MKVKRPERPNDLPMAATDEPSTSGRVLRRCRGGMAHSDRGQLTAEEIERVVRRYPWEI